MEDIIYVVKIEDICDGDVIENDIEVYTDLDKANARVKELRDEYMEEFGKTNMIIEDETSEDDSLYMFEMYYNGYYNRDHVHIAVYQREIQY